MTGGKWLGWTCALALLSLFAADVKAQSLSDQIEIAEEEEQEDAAFELREPELDPEPIVLARRAVPNYDGREPEGEGARGALWLPRLLLAPVYFVTEYVLRRPLRYLFSLGESSSKDPLRFFVFGDGRLAIVPTFLADFGNQPSAGIYVRWNEAGHENHRMRLHFATWGKHWLKGRLTSRWENDNLRGELRVSALRRPDGLFSGLGGSARPGLRTARYQFRRLEALASFEARPWRESVIEARLALRELRFSNDAFRGPTVADFVNEGELDSNPAGFEGYFISETQVSFDLNSRQRTGNTSGFELRVAGGYAFDVQTPSERQWLSYAVNAAGHIDIGHRRVLSLSATVQGTEAVAGEVPFTELPQVGGSEALPGFRRDTLRGQSTATLVARYSWPIWVWLNATLHVGVGNAYDGRFENMTMGNQRMGFGLGFSAVNNIDHIVNFILAWGTDTFDRGASVDSFRLTVGATWRL
ncbi:MAG: hypothetical protein AB8H86_15930 [Polyangiales bacterium]